MPVAETVAWEHSEPGTGPMPVYQDIETDKAMKYGWRRDPWPVAYPGYEDPFFYPVVGQFSLPFEVEEEVI